MKAIKKILMACAFALFLWCVGWAPTVLRILIGG